MKKNRKNKEYKVTSKVAYAFMKSNARRRLGEAYIEADKHYHAARSFTEAEVLVGKAWELVYELYPKLKRKIITYSHTEKLIRMGSMDNES